MTGNLHIIGRDKEYLSYALNFMTFENMSKKLWPNILRSTFFVNGQFGLMKKNQFFQKQKFEIGFLELYVRRKLGIIPF